MSSTGSVTQWISQLKAGDQAAAQKLWQGYFERLVGLARLKLKGTPRRAADEEDVALSAFDSFCRGAAQGRFPQLADRDDLWQLLAVITAHKASKLARRERQQKRGGDVLNLSQVSGPSSRPEAVLERVLDSGPTPEFAAQLAEECRRLLGVLADDQLRAVALWKMENYTNAEIAVKLGCVVRTVERKLRVIRSRWKQEIAS